MHNTCHCEPLTYPACFSLHAPRWEVSVDIENVGGVYGCDVPQLYLGFPEGSGEPVSLVQPYTIRTCLIYLCHSLEYSVDSSASL